MSPSPSSAQLVPPSSVLASTSPSSFFHPSVSLDHIYTSHDADSLWGYGLQAGVENPDWICVSF